MFYPDTLFCREFAASQRFHGIRAEGWRAAHRLIHPGTDPRCAGSTTRRASERAGWCRPLPLGFDLALAGRLHQSRCGEQVSSLPLKGQNRNRGCTPLSQRRSPPISCLAGIAPESSQRRLTRLRRCQAFQVLGYVQSPLRGAQEEALIPRRGRPGSTDAGEINVSTARSGPPGDEGLLAAITAPLAYHGSTAGLAQGCRRP